MLNVKKNTLYICVCVRACHKYVMLLCYYYVYEICDCERLHALRSTADGREVGITVT